MDPRNIFVLLFSIAILNSIFSYIKLRRFISDTTQITSENDLEKFKDMVRTQMKMAILQMAIMALMLITGIYGIITQELSLIFVILLYAIIMIAGMFFKKAENTAKSLKVADDGLRQNYKGICKKWDKKPFPDF